MYKKLLPDYIEKSEQRLYRWANRILTIGVIGSLLLIIIGVLVMLITHNYNTDAPLLLSNIGMSLSHGEPIAIIGIGLIVLLATPVLQVLTALVSFVIGRDRAYIGITLIILAVLSISIALALH